MNTSEALALALQHHQAGRLAEAETLYRQVLAVQPDHAEALHFLGVIAHQAGRPEVAIDLIRRSLALQPANTAARSNLGAALAEAGRLDEAVAAYRRAIELNPGDAPAHYNLGNALRIQGRPDEAIAAYEHALRLEPNLAETHNNLGLTLAEQGRFEEAAATYRRALDLRPNYPEAHINLGNALTAQGQFDEALAEFQYVLELQPELAELHNNLGTALRGRGSFEEAVAAHRRALALRQDFAEAHNNLGTALLDLGRIDEALAAYHRALALKADYPEARYNLARAFNEQGLRDEALAALRAAVALKPDYAEAHNNLAVMLHEQGQIDEAIAAHRRAIACRSRDASLHSNLIFALHHHPGEDDRSLAAEQENWNQRFGASAERSSTPHTDDRNPARRLRIGYVSADFREHVVGYNLLPLFAHHNRASFEVFCYSGVADADRKTEKFRKLADHWRDTARLLDDALAAQIRRDGIDILIDLSLHTAANRLPVFARRAAPVQASFAGYPGSTGLSAIPFRIGDRHLEGMNAARQPSTFLIDSFWCYHPPDKEIAVNELPALKNGRVTFGVLSSPRKINDRVLKLWARVLCEVVDSRLLIMSPAGAHRVPVLRTFENEGVAPERAEFVEPRPRTAYLELYHWIDIALDPFPYNGHTTSLDALWMGVPVIGLVGERAVARGGFSVLSNAGLPELAAFSASDYVRIAGDLARDLPRLAELRSILRSRLQSSILMDAPRFAASIESAYRQMWRRWCAQPPNSLR